MFSNVAELPRWARWLNSSLGVGRLCGIPIRIHIFTILVPLMVVSNLSGLPIAERWGYGLGMTMGLYLIVLTHELGHALAGRRYHIRTESIVLHPLGGFAHLQSSPPHPNADMFVALAGPAVHLPWLAVIYVAEQLLPEAPAVVRTSLAWAWTTNLYLLGFNLLPFYPLDGGRALRGLISKRWHPNLASRVSAQIGILGAIGILLYGFATAGAVSSILVLISISMIFACLQEISAARYGPGPYGEPREPWEQDPDAWKHGAVTEEREERRERRRAHRSPPSDPPRPRAVTPDPDLDRLLARVGEVGMAGLTSAERTALEEASRRLRSDRPPRS